MRERRRRSPRGAKSLRVMTYNIKGHGALLRSSHLAGIAEVIRRADADLIGIQEVHRGTWKARFVDQARELERLTGLNLCFGRAFEKNGTEYGNAILTRGRILGATVHPLPGTGEPRTALQTTLEFDGTQVNAFVTHLAAWGRLGAKKRLAQAEAVARITDESELPFILTGDFNSAPTSEELRVFHAGDLVLSCFVDPIVTHRATRQCLDYIFCDPGWQIRNARVVTEGPSDHWPLVAEIEGK